MGGQRPAEHTDPPGGGGLSDELAEYQRPLGRDLLDSGADVVIGSHPHRVLGIERHNGKANLYSPVTLVEQLSREGLAPEIAGIMDRLAPDSFVATLELAPDGEYEIRIIPTTNDDDGVPVPAEGEAFARIAERLVRMSAALGTEVEVRERSLASRSVRLCLPRHEAYLLEGLPASPRRALFAFQVIWGNGFWGSFEGSQGCQGLVEPGLHQQDELAKLQGKRGGKRCSMVRRSTV